MTNSLEALIACIKPELKIALDKTQKQSDALLAIDRLSDLLTLPAVDALIAALEEAHLREEVLYAANDGLGRRIAELEKRLEQTEETLITATDQVTELESRQLKPVKLPAACSDDEYFIDGIFQPLRYERDIERALHAAGIQVEGG